MINRKPEDVYDFVTNAGDWPKWHENSHGVEGDINGPMQLNDVVRELGKIPLKTGYLEWKCTVRDYPHEFKIDGEGMGGRGYVQYNFRKSAEGTEFTRTLDFGFEKGFMKFIESMITPMVRKKQTESVRNLKEAVEKYTEAR
ncbi:MAG: SRPBCC family protein [Spirochaetes bacterium]|nr:SRPBCC family protein [Spirochaetota bacterium]